MAEFGIPDEPGFRGAPVLGPLASSVAGFTQGLERGLQSRQQKKAALAKQRAQESVARTRAGASVARRLDSDLGDLTRGDTDRVKELDRQRKALQARLDDKLSSLTDDEKQTIRFDMNLIDDETNSLRSSISAITKVGISARGLTTKQQQTILTNLLEVGLPRQFDNFELFIKMKKDFLGQFDPAVAQRLDALLEAERKRGNIRIDRDILGPGPVVLDEKDLNTVKGFFDNG